MNNSIPGFQDIFEYIDILKNPSGYISKANSSELLETTISLLTILKENIDVFYSPTSTRPRRSATDSIPGFIEPSVAENRDDQSKVLLILRFLLYLPTDAFSKTQWQKLGDV